MNTAQTPHASAAPATTSSANRKAGGVAFERVSKRYGSVTAVDDLSFTIAPATLVTLLGPSGCGKTTTLRMVAGLETASAGRITIGGQDVTQRAAHERDVSMVFQSYALFPHMTVLENVCYGPLAGGASKARARELARAKLDQLGLGQLEQRLPAELSGGQQQRVAVARSLVQEPAVLLFDEPLSNLDAKLRRRVRQEIRELQQELALTVLYVTHDQSEALAVSDHVIVMNAGRIAQQGTPRELYEQPASRFLADFIGDANLIDGQLARREGQRVFSAGGVDLALAPAAAADHAPDHADGPATLALRPHRLRLLPAGQGLLQGRCRRADYLGSHIELLVDTAWGTLLAFGPAEAGASQMAWRSGDALGLGFDASDAIVLAA